MPDQSQLLVLMPIQIVFRQLATQQLILRLFQTTTTMALLSAFNIIRIISILHITIAYYFLVDPRLIAEQNFVFLIGNSMDMVIFHKHIHTHTRGTRDDANQCSHISPTSTKRAQSPPSSAYYSASSVSPISSPCPSVNPSRSNTGAQ